MIHGVFFTVTFGDLGEVGFVSCGVFTVEDLTAALVDSTGVGYVCWV